MNQFLKRTLQGDLVVWVVYTLLCIFSIVEMFSASSSLVYKTGSIQGPIMRHVIHLLVGFLFLLATQVIKFKYVRSLGYMGLFFSIILLFYTLAFGTVQQGAARFISVVGFQFQPSEVAKLSLLIVLADQIEHCQVDKEYESKYFWWIMSTVLLVCLLIFVENFSTAAILYTIACIMMWIGGINWKKILKVCGVIFCIVLLILLISYIFPDNNISFLHRADTWVARIENFIQPEKTKFYINEDNLQEVHSQIAIARGGFAPHGPGTSIERNYLPEAFSDFIFAIIIEELGFIFGIMIIGLYIYLLYSAGIVARHSTSLFCAILVIGITLLIVLQALVHIGVSVHLGPVTGQPLPLISRGGTSILINSVYLGLLLSVTREIQKQDKNKPIKEVQENKEISNNSSIEVIEDEGNIKIIN